jgi:hypothetical protein
VILASGPKVTRHEQLPPVGATSVPTAIQPSPTPILNDSLPHAAFFTGLFLQIVLAAAAIWLAVETRLLRKRDEVRARQADEQLTLLRKQMRLSVMPPVVVTPHNRESYTRWVEHEYPNPDSADRRSELLDIAHRGDRWASLVVVVSNASEKNAHNILCYWYHAETDKYSRGDLGIEQLRGDWKVVPFFRSPEEFEAIKERLQFSYPDKSTDHFLQYLQPLPNDWPFVAAFFTDVDGELHMARRAFTFINGRISRSKTESFHEAIGEQ